MIFLKRVLIYMALLAVSFFALAAGWAFLAPICLFHCWDDAPPFAVSWCPPFIHPWANSLDGKLRDYFIAPEWLVYSVWLLFVAGVFIFPAVVVFGKFVTRKTSSSHKTS